MTRLAWKGADVFGTHIDPDVPTHCRDAQRFAARVEPIVGMGQRFWEGFWYVAEPCADRVNWQLWVMTVEPVPGALPHGDHVDTVGSLARAKRLAAECNRELLSGREIRSRAIRVRLPRKRAVRRGRRRAK